jgi:hypothetical protein
MTQKRVIDNTGGSIEGINGLEPPDGRPLQALIASRSTTHIFGIFANAALALAAICSGGRSSVCVAMDHKGETTILSILSRVTIFVD